MENTYYHEIFIRLHAIISFMILCSTYTVFVLSLGFNFKLESLLQKKDYVSDFLTWWDS